MMKPLFAKFLEKVKRYVAGAPPEGIATLELQIGQETRDTILEQVRAERQINSDISVWILDAKDSFFKFLVSIDLVAIGFVVALQASGHLHELVRNENIFRWGIRLLILHFVLCLAISAVWPKFISSESMWHYIKSSNILSKHIKLQNEHQNSQKIGRAYNDAFNELERERANIFKERPRVYNVVRLFTLPWLWALILIILMGILLTATRFNSLI